MNAHRAYLALLLAAGLAGAAVPAAARTTPQAAPAARRVDRYGDPLPPGAVARLGTWRLRHPNPVNALAFSPDGRFLASVGSPAVVWDVLTGREVRRLEGTWTYGAAHFTPGGELLAGSEYGLDRWGITSGKRLASSPESAWRLAVTPDGKTLVSTARQALAVRDPASLRVLRRIKAPTVYPSSHLALSPDGKTVAATLASGGIGLWEVASGKPLPLNAPGLRHASPLALGPDGRTLAAGTWGGEVRLWDVTTGKELRRLSDPGGTGKTIAALAFGPGAKVLACGYSGGQIRVWDLAGRRSLDLQSGADPSWDLRALAFSPDGKTLVSGRTDGALRLWETATGKERLPREGHLYGAHAVAFLPDSRTVASADFEGGRLWRARTGECVKVFGTGAPTSLPVALRADGRVAAVIRERGTVTFWDLPGRKVVRELKGLPLDPGLFAVGAGDLLARAGDRHVRVFGPTGRPLWHAAEQEDWFFIAAAFSRDGKRLAALSVAESKRRRGDPPKPVEQRVWLWEAGTGKRVRSWELGAWLQFADLALSPDGSRLAVVIRADGVAGHKPGPLWMYEAATGKRLYTLEAPPRGFWAAAFSADGQTLATGEGDGAVCVREAASGRLRRRFAGHTGPVRALSFSPDGRLLVSACYGYGGDHTPLVWDLTGQPGGGKGGLAPAGN
jgi:WD40 repeat protein